MVDVSIWKCLEFDELGSTNDEIKKYCAEAGKFIALRANKQTAGRGRRGRSWVSDEGNLFFSIALEFDLKNIGKLVSICGLSVLQAINNIRNVDELELKWPNDVLLKGKKVCGMLLEKSEGDYIVCGIGINVNHTPQVENILYEATCLKDADILTTPKELMTEFLKVFSQNLSLLHNQGFAVLRTEWLKKAKNLQKKIVVHQDNVELTGIFRGIDENAGLLLDVNGTIHKIWAGDVFFVENDNE